MESRRPAIQHLWNRFLAAVLFVMGAALNTAAVPESQETQVSRAERTQLEAAAEIGRQLSAVFSVRPNIAGDNASGDQPATAPSIITHAPREAGGSATLFQPAHVARWPDRTGLSRAPPSI